MTTNNQGTKAPFSCTYSPNVPQLLADLDCSLVLSTYQAHKVIFLSPHFNGLIQLPRNFEKPMGLGVNGRYLAIATKHEVVILADDPNLASHHPSKPNEYDAFYVPRVRYVTNELDIHDLRWSGDTLWAVNTLFSCICTIDYQYSFTPQWWPSYITELAAEDRCHLNGMAMVNGRPTYATALDSSDTSFGWRDNKLTGGVLIDIESNEIILNGLPMPHSPRVYEGELYVLLSANGDLVRVDRQSGSYETIVRLPGFVRGMTRFRDYLFIGMSRLRPGRVLGDLPLAQRDDIFSGVAIVHLASGQLAGTIRYEQDCEEIYDVQVLPGVRRPGIVGLDSDMYRNVLSTPGNSFWGTSV